MSVTKASIAPDNSALVATDVKNAADVTLATNSNSDNIAEGYSSISSNDTHVKYLGEALVAGLGVTITENNDGADETLTISAEAAALATIGRVDADTLVVSTGFNDSQTLIDLATAGNWIGGASLESASEFVHVYEVVAALGTYKLSDKQPQYTAPVEANRIADMQVNQAGWVGTAGLGLNAATVVYQNGTTGDAVAVGNYAIFYDDSIFTLGRGRGTGAGIAVGNLSVAKITATTGGAATGTLTLEANHQIAINDHDYIIIVDAGKLGYRFDGGAWYRHVDAWFNNSAGDLIDLTAQYGNHQQYMGNDYVADEGVDYTTVSASLVAIDSTNFSLEVATYDRPIMIGFSGSFSNDTINARMSLDVLIDGVALGGDDGLTTWQQEVAAKSSAVSFVRRKVGLPAGVHTIELFWSTSVGELRLYAGAGTADRDVHPQLWVN